MKSSIPAPIGNHIIKLSACIAILTVVGIGWSIAAADRITLILTGMIAIAGTGKAVALYRTAQCGDYEIVEGVMTEFRNVPLRKKQQLFFLGKDGTKIDLLVEGKKSWKVQQCYRLYLQHDRQSASYEAIPPYLRPARILLGSEFCD